MTNQSFSHTPPPDASRYFKNKGIAPSFDWREVWQAEHAMAFTVAKAMQMDVLTDIRTAVQRAIDEGWTLDRFRKELTPVLQQHGWWGRKNVVDPLTGQLASAQLGSPRRLRTIYNANLRTARAAGQWDRAQRTKTALPYFRYELGPSREHRADHASLAGLILPIDDPFWDTHFPPNGWGCKCRVRQITAAEAGSLNGPGEAPAISWKTYTNKRTGEVMQVPADIDPGWASNPGRTRQANLERFLDGRLQALPDAYARVAVVDMVSSWKFGGIYRRELQDSVPVGMLPQALATRLGSDTRVVRFSAYTAVKGKRRHADMRQEDYAIVQELLDTGTRVQEDAYNMAFFGMVKGKAWRCVVKRTRDGKELYLSTLHRTQVRRFEGYAGQGDVLTRD
jgi:hypothetical protein